MIIAVLSIADFVNVSPSIRLDSISTHMLVRQSTGSALRQELTVNLPDLIGRAAARASDLVAEIGKVDLDAPSTCADFDQRALANHLTGFLPYAANAARRGPAMEGEAPDFAASPEWVAEFAAMAADTAAAWAEPGATEGSVQFGRGEMPAEYAAGITLMELTIHAWDLARSTGHAFSTDPDVADAVKHIVGQAVQGGGGDFFGPAIETASADALDQALALSGRDPGIQPAP